METSAIQKLEDLLLVSVPRDLMDDEVLHLRRQVVREIRKHHTRWVMLDFSAVDICDSFFGRFIQSTADMVGLMGADVIVSGLQDAVVETMVELGMVLPNIHAVLNLDDALTLSRATHRVQAPWELDGTLDLDEDGNDWSQFTTEPRNQADHPFDGV